MFDLAPSEGLPNVKMTMILDEVHLLLLVPASSCGPAQVRDATAPS